MLVFAVQGQQVVSVQGLVLACNHTTREHHHHGTTNRRYSNTAHTRIEIGMKRHLTIKVAGSRLRWAGHIQRMSEEILTKIAWKTEEDGRKGRLKLR